MIEPDILDFEQRCLSAWGAPTRSIEQLIGGGRVPQIRDMTAFDDASSALKVHIAEKLIVESCSHVGSFAGSGDPEWFLYGFANDSWGGLGHDGSFAGRRVLPLKSALLLTVKRSLPLFTPHSSEIDIIFAGGGAVAAVYLLAQLEFVFREKGRYLNESGNVVTELPEQLKRRLGIRGNRGDLGARINGIDQAFLMYLYRTPTALAKRLRVLERRFTLSHRLSLIRNPAMHGSLPDPAVEGVFYGLLMAMLRYGEDRR